MQLFLHLAVFFLIATICAGLLRVWRGPTVADRLLTTQLFGTTGMAILIVLAGARPEPTLLNVAITFNVLAALLVVCFVKAWSGRKRGSSGEGGGS